MKTRTIENVPMWMGKYDTIDALAEESSDRHFVSNIHASLQNMEDCGWTRVGVATMTVEIFDQAALVENKVASLNAELQKERADSEVRQNAILLQISKLQALEFDEGSQ